MRIGLLSDAHGNAVALRACLDAMTRLAVDEMYFLGDAVGYLPGEVEVLRSLRGANVRCQKGNHEAMLLGELDTPAERAGVYRLDEVRTRLSDAAIAEIRAWPIVRTLQIVGRRILLVHGSPDRPLEGYVYPDTDIAPFASLPYDIVALGNTHRPFARRVGSVVVVNVGSCGLPRDAGEFPAFAVYDSEDDEPVIYRVRVERRAVVAQYGDAIPAAVLEVLSRQPSAPLVGRILDS